MRKLTEEQLKEYRYVIDNNGYNTKLYQLVSVEFSAKQNIETLFRLGFSDVYAIKTIQWWRLRVDNVN